MDPGKTRKVTPRASSNREKANFPVKNLIKNGVIDRQKVYYILKNPEEPKCKVTISALLKQYNEHKRKALNVSRNTHFDGSVVKNLDLLIEGDVEFHQLPQEFRQNLFLENLTGHGANSCSSVSSSSSSSSSTVTLVDESSSDESVEIIE